MASIASSKTATAPPTAPPMIAIRFGRRTLPDDVLSEATEADVEAEAEVRGEVVEARDELLETYKFHGREPL